MGCCGFLQREPNRTQLSAPAPTRLRAQIFRSVLILPLRSSTAAELAQIGFKGFPRRFFNITVAGFP